MENDTDTEIVFFKLIYKLPIVFQDKMRFKWIQTVLNNNISWFSRVINGNKKEKIFFFQCLPVRTMWYRIHCTWMICQRVLGIAAYSDRMIISPEWIIQQNILQNGFENDEMMKVTLW